MQTVWSDVRLALEQLAATAIDWDPDGIDLKFVSLDVELTGCQNLDLVLKLFDDVYFPSALPAAGLFYAIDQILANHM